MIEGRKTHASATFLASELKANEGFVLRKNHGAKIPAAPATAVRVRKKIDWRMMMIQNIDDNVACGWSGRQIRLAMKVADEMPVTTKSHVSVGSALASSNSSAGMEPREFACKAAGEEARFMA